MILSEIIVYLEDEYKITDEDLTLPDDERYMLLGQRALITQLKEIDEHGIPTDEESE